MTHLRLTPAMASHRGMRRRNNEDAIGYDYPSDTDVLTTYGALFIVADGVGGLPSGEEASRMAVEQLKRRFYGSVDDMPPAERLEATVKQVNRDVYNAFKRQGATTLVTTAVLEDRYIAVSVGDSQIFRIRAGEITQLNTEDVMHSNDSNNGALTKAIGYRENLDFEILEGELQPDDIIVLCSDGLTRYVSSASILQLASMPDPRDSVRRLVNEANHAGGADNISVLVVKVGDTIALDEVPAHQASMSVRVAVDTDPMMMVDVPSKPHTQIPQGRPSANLPEEILTETERVVPEKPVSQPPPRPIAPPVATAQSGVPPTEAGNNNLVIIGAVAALVIGAVIFAIALFSLSSNPAPSDTSANDNVTTTLPADTQPTIQIEDRIQLSVTTRTLVDIGSDEESFLAESDTSYLVDNIVQD
ncbi:MAG: protein phosphatase 2C domain-containing protein, partial [Chloroflexota bacterium]